MAGTNVVNVPAGTQLVPTSVTPLHSTMIAPAVLGGTVLLESAPSQSGPWFTQLSAAGSFRPPTNAWIRVTATTQAATVAITDLGTANVPGIDQLINVNGVLASSSSTAEQILASWRIPPNYLFPGNNNWRMDIRFAASFTNNANAKSLNIRANGIAGTSMFASGALASLLNYVAIGSICSVGGDGQTMKGFGVTLTSFNTSSTAFPTLARDFINQETEFVVTCTKATAGDAFQLDSMFVNMQ